MLREVKVASGADCPLINIPVGKKKKFMTWSIDSGAQVNVLDEVSFHENFPGVRLEEIPEGWVFKNADGSPLSMSGVFVTNIWFGKKPTLDEIYVCKGVMKTRLLGPSLLSKFDSWGVDNKKGVFMVEGEEKVSIPLVHTAGKPPRTCELRLSESVEIPAKSCCFVRADLPGRYEPTEFVFHPHYKVFQKKKVALPVSLVASNAFDGTCLIKATNPTSEVKVLGKGTKIGKVVTNLEDYTFSGQVTEETNKEGIGVHSVQVEPIDEVEDRMKKKNPDLYKLYASSVANLQNKEKEQLLRLLYKYIDVFSVDDDDLGLTTLIKHKIVPKSEEVVYRRQYRHSEEQHKRIDEEVDRLLKNGVIRESMSPFNSPVLMVPKKEPGKWRFCLDCRYINDLTEDQYFPIPLIHDAMDSLGGSSIFTVFDMTMGYFQVELADETSDMCAFSTRKGHFQFNRLPMGLRNSGMTFQKMVTLLMSGMLYSEVLAYLDDCILYSKSVQQHFKTVEEVLHRFKGAGLKLKPRKCHLFQKEIVYLGFLVDKDGIRPNPEAVRKIMELPEPTCVTDVQRILGKVNYYRKFVPKLAEIAHPLYTLTECKSKASFCWEAEHQSAFDTLKASLCSGQVMGHPRFDLEFILDVDASDFALGAELSQIEENGDERPIYYASRHLEKAERCYSATARETLAAVFGCEHFSHYLQGKRFVLRTDHNPLVWLRSMKNPKRPYNGWIVRLEQFNYKIQYRPGKQHVNADFNSRMMLEEVAGHRSIAVQTEGGNTSTLADCISTKEVPVHSGVKEAVSVQQRRVQQVRNSVDPKLKNHHMHTVKSAPVEVLKSNGVCSVMSVNDGEGGSLDVPGQFLADEQAKDVDISSIIQKIQDPRRDIDLSECGRRLWKIRSSLFVKDGVLFRLYRVKAGLNPIEQVVLPVSLKKMVLESLHDDVFAGHFGVKRTVARVKLRYYWPGYLRDIEEWCKTCMACQRRKNPQSRNVAPMRSIETGQGPFEQIALDILKLPRTRRGNQFVLLVEDYFSKWVEAFPLKRTIAPSVAQCVLNGWISRFGCPYSILSDQGSEFTSELFMCLSESMQVKKLRTTPYHPRTDGMVERSNRTLIDVLSKYAEKDPDWDLRLPLALFAVRTSEHATTGFSPFLLTYGKEAKIPWDIVYGPPPNEPLPQDEWVATRKQELSKVFKLVRESTQKSQCHQKRYFDKNLKGCLEKFEVGDQVMLCDPSSRSKNGKLHQPWLGPYQVVGKLSDALYRVKLSTGKEVVANVERLKGFHARIDVQGDVHRDYASSESSDDENLDDDYNDYNLDAIGNEGNGPDHQSEHEEDAPDHVEGHPEDPAQPEEITNGADAILEVRDQGTRPPPLLKEGGRLWCNI